MTYAMKLCSGLMSIVIPACIWMLPMEAAGAEPSGTSPRVSVSLVLLEASSGQQTTTDLGSLGTMISHQSELTPGKTVFLEAWCRTPGPHGMTTAVIDLTYQTEFLDTSAAQVSLALQWNLLPFTASVDDEAGGIDDLGGNDRLFSGLGVGEWARIGTIEFDVTSTPSDPVQFCSHFAGETPAGIPLEFAIWGEGSVDPDEVAYGCFLVGCNTDADCNDGVACTVDSCNPATGCTNTPVHDACDDGNDCTDDVCTTAGCVHPNLMAGTACGDSTADDCTDADTCDGAGACLDNHVADGTGCTDDGNECTDDVCTSGACTHPDLSAGTACGDPADDDCTNPDTCDGAGTCLDNHEIDGTSCTDDGNECTEDVCGAGACTHPNLAEGTPCDDPSDSECDNPDTCNGLGACEENWEPDGTPCPDSLFCNGQEMCDGGGTCQPGTPVLCPQVECGDTCNEEQHSCSTPAGVPCGDPGDTDCDNPDTCDGNGACVGNLEPLGAPCGDPTDTECDDPDSCDGAGTCLPNYAPAGSSCGDPADDDCTDPDTCDGTGACLDNHEPPGTLCGIPHNDCTSLTCDGAGTCGLVNLPPGTLCGDRADTDCDDPDSCDGAGTCLSNYVSAGAACGDPADDDCTDPDTCDGSGACLDNHESAEAPCPDELFCNGEETCDGAGTCQPGSSPCSDPLRPFCSEDTDECVKCLVDGDTNGDAVFDLLDLSAFPECMTGPVGPLDPPAYPQVCRCLDVDADGNVDLLDFQGLQGNLQP